MGRHAKMKVRLGWSTAIVSVVAAFLMVFVVPAGIAAASSPDLTPGPAYTLWAYGVVRTVDFSGVSGDGFVYQGSATYGYAVILNQTNLTTSTFELSVNRTMGVNLAVEYCTPNCKHPNVVAKLTHVAWESVDAWANFTTNGTVLENGQNVSALALLNSHSTVTGDLVDTARGPLRSANLTANVSATASVNFDTPLGLLPNNLTVPSSWSSASAFTASGEYSIGYSYSLSGPKGTLTVGPTSLTAGVERTGTVTVSGSVNAGPASTVNFGGVSFTNVSLNVEGPFVAREGFILVPDTVDLFGTESSNVWSGNESGATTVQMTSLYVHPGRGAHLGIGGSEWLYTASSLNPTSTSLSPSEIAGAGVPEIAAGADNVGSTPVQGVPETVGPAQTQQNCLLTGSNCPTVAGKPLIPFLTLGIVAVVVAAVVGMVLLAERRRIPPPTYPNAKLYPPGAAGAKPLDSNRSSGVRRPPPVEDDPLSNLW
jgi:hypothetical protein